MDKILTGDLYMEVEDNKYEKVAKCVSLENHYNSNEDFRDYVHKYCLKTKKTVEEAFQDAIVRDYLDYLLKRD